MPHVLVVGGTGMLRGVPLYFTKHAYTVSVIARSQNGFDKLILEKGESGFINPVKVDYGNYVSLKEKLAAARNDYGEFDACVCWIHSTAPEAPYIIAELASAQKSVSKFYHVLPCESSEPDDPAFNIEKTFEKYSNLIYRKIILGFVVDSGKSRWLTNEEISNGVIDAVLAEKNLFVIGQVRPVELKP